MGITATPEGRADFADVWRSLDQRDIIRPSLAVRANLWLWFAIMQTALVRAYASRRHRANALRRRRTAAERGASSRSSRRSAPRASSRPAR
jgi:hypothetical protein